MSRFVATQAQRLQLKARIGLTGSTNTGKTYTALVIAAGLLKSEGCVLEDGSPDWSKVVLIDTERQRALFYANNGRFGKFLHIDFTPPYSPQDYVEAVKYAESLGAKVCIIDSLSHAWSGTGGVLEIVNERTANSRTKNQFSEGWGGKDGGTALQNDMINNILSCGMHTICTFRQKMEYVQEKDEATGKTVIRKMGIKPTQRDDLEYEFDLTLKLNNDHTAEIIKNTIEFIGKNEEIIPVITEEFGIVLGNYLNSGASIQEHQQQLKETYIQQIKEMADAHPALYDYYLVKYDGVKLAELTLSDLKDVLREFKEML